MAQGLWCRIVIWLLRHGDAADGTPDAERPLTDKGREQSRAAGLALKAMGVRMDACLTSPKVRAAETAELACAELGIEPRAEPELAGGPFDPEALAGGFGGEVLLVGHDPDFSEAIGRLTGARVSLKKGGVAGVQDDELRVLLRPKELRRIG
jgi:phosphohistidine phosphatase